MKRTYFLSFIRFFLLFFVTHPSVSQKLKWKNEVDYPIQSSGEYNFIDIRMDKSGNLYGVSNNYTDALLYRYNPSNGDTLWIRKFDNLTPSEIEFDQDENIIVGGSVPATNAGTNNAEDNYDFYIAKISPAGEMLWDFFYNDPRNTADRLSSITIDSSGNVLATGFTNKLAIHTIAATDILTLKVSPSGVLLWQKLYNGASLKDEGKSVKVDPEGNVYVTGVTVATLNEPGNLILLKYNPAGTLDWEKVYNRFTNKLDSGAKILVDADDHIIVAGVTSESSGPNKDIVLLKYSASGSLLWTYLSNDPSYDETVVLGISQDIAGDYYFGSNFYSITTSYFGGFVTKVSNAGTQKWKKIAGSGFYHKGSDFEADKYGNCFIVFYHENFMTDAIIAKVNKNSNLDWTYTYKSVNSSEYEQAQTVCLDNKGWVYVGGQNNLVNLDIRPLAFAICYVDDQCFEPESTHLVDASPTEMVSVDVNNDTYPDIISANHKKRSFTVALNNGAGVFTKFQMPAMPKGPHQVSAADYDNDGNMDLSLTIDSLNVVHVYKGAGDGNFSFHASYATGTKPTDLISADLNTDGIIDLAVCNTTSGTISVFINQGNGSFNAKVDYTSEVNVSSLIAADFNQDGHNDIATVTRANPANIGIFINNGNGTFMPFQNYATASNSLKIVAGHFNDDAFIDLACGATTNNLYIHKNNGDGTFTYVSTFAAATIFDMTVTDFNNDGKDDIVVGRTNSPVLIYLRSKCGPAAFEPITLTTSISMNVMAVNDFNKDGRKDVMVGNTSYTYLISRLTCTYGTSGVVTHLQNQERDAEHFFVYPNPFSEECTFKSSSKFANATLVIYNLVGEEIFRSQGINGDSFRLKRGNWPAGIYIFNILENGIIMNKGKMIAN